MTKTQTSAVGAVQIALFVLGLALLIDGVEYLGIGFMVACIAIELVMKLVIGEKAKTHNKSLTRWMR